ncbi:hypothetical protein J4461_03820 [Candidatus Pacearchaeota archaeon]|nr:hypothetical protein [Candidatus Pacearchaeota archaeon]
MPADMYTLNRTKEQILSFIKSNGPSLPVHIARDIRANSLFTAAFLSELYNEGKIRMSNMKIGSSSLYYLPDQHSLLEKFAVHLNQREKEALALLQKEKVLEDSSLEPVIRVAIRSIKDFAVPFSVNSVLLWKHFSLTEEEAKRHFNSKNLPHSPIKEEKTEGINTRVHVHTADVIEEIVPQQKIKREQIQKKEPLKRVELSLSFSSPTVQKQQVPPSPFLTQLKEILIKKNIEMIELLSDNKKDIRAKVSLNTPLGMQSYFLVAKNKKRLKADELIEALKEAHSQKMPALVMAPGDIEKKARDILSEWSHLLKFEKLV